MRLKLPFLSIFLFALLFGFFLPQSAFADTVTLSGSVKDSGGSAISGANISINDANSSSTTTDSSGNYTLVISNGTYNVQTMPPAGSTFSPAIALNQNVSANTVLNFILAPIGTTTVSGHIYDAGGTPVQNQTVGLLKYSDGSEIDVTTDGSGGYSFDQVTSGANYRFIVKGGSSTLKVPQHYSIFFNYTPTQNSTLDITIPAKKVVINVKDAANNPVSNVAVSAGPSGGSGNPVNLSLPINGDTATATTSYSGSSPVTDSSGNVTLWLLPNDSGYPVHLYTFTATPPSGSDLFSTILSNTSITADTNLTITMQEPVTISGHIYDPSGDALPNQTVRLLKYSDGSTVDVVTDSTGAYALQQITTGTAYRFIVSGGNGNNPTIHVPQNYSMFGDYTPTQDATINVTIPAKKVTVHVQDSLNNPVSNIAITANPESGTGGPVNYSLPIGGGIVGTATTSYEGSSIETDSSGNAILWLLPNNDSNNFSNHLYVLTATPPNGSIYSSLALNNISVTEDQTELISLQYSHDTPTTTADLTTQNPDETYSDPTSVALTASAAAGHTVANTYYTIDGGSQQTHTNPFSVTGNGEHSIEYWSVDNSGVQESHHTQTFTIHSTYSLSGTVYIDANDNGVQDSGEVGYNGGTLTLNSGQTATTNASGSYTIPDLQAGTYTETLTIPNGYVATTTNHVSFPLASNTTENFGIINATTTLAPVADSYIKSGSQNENEGASSFLRIQSSGHNRALVKFDQSQIQQAVGSSQNYTATLSFTISDNGNNWGTTGRTIDLDRLTRNWAEGNGFIDGSRPKDRGTGSGLT
jgi:hypothetical protein